MTTAAEALAMAGQEAAYAERTSDWTTSNTSASSTAAGSLISDLVVEVEGNGRPVELEFWTGAAYNSANANYWFNAIFHVDGVPITTEGTFGAGSSPSTTTGRYLIVKRRLVIPDGVTKDIQVGAFGQSAGTVFKGFTTAPMYLSAVYR